MKKTFLLPCLAICILVGACSSKRTRPESASEPQSSAQASPGLDISSGPETDAQPPPREVVEAPSKGFFLEQRYKALSQALRNQSGKSSAVQDEASRILGTNPNDPVALNTLALIHLRRGRPAAARLLLTRALEKNPPEAAALYNNMGVAFLDEGDRESAALQFKKALKLDDRHAETCANMGSIYLQGGDFGKALPLLEAAYKKNRSNLAVANNYAIALRSKGDLDGARGIYEDVIKQNGRDVHSLLNYAILLIEFMNKPKDGLDLVYKVKFIETQRKDVLSRANALEKKAKAELK